MQLFNETKKEHNSYIDRKNQKDFDVFKLMTEDKQKKEEKQGIFGSIGSFLLLLTVVLAFKSSILDANNIPTGSMLPTLKIGDFLFVNKMRYSIRIPFSETEIYRYDNPKRGDIVTFIPPAGAVQPIMGFELFPKRFVKRVIGLPGDTIKITKTPADSLQGRGFLYISRIEYKPEGGDAFIPYQSHEIPVGNELDDLDNIHASTRALFLEGKPGFDHFVIDGYNGREGIGNQVREYIYEIPADHYMMVGDNRDDSFDSREWGYVHRDAILGKALVLYFSINWRDHSCAFRDEADLVKNGPELAAKYEGQELFNRCADSYQATLYSDLPRDYHHEMIRNSDMSWLKKTFGYRIWRMDVRWDRIGKILR